jgi:hypothetical protein
MIYLLKRTGPTVIALITIANDDEIPSGFEVITEAQYDQAQSALDKDEYLLYDDQTGVFTANNELANEAEAIDNKLALRSRLRKLSIELDLAARMVEDTTALQSEFAALKADYEAL